jgi:hypothetical protein
LSEEGREVFEDEDGWLREVVKGGIWVVRVLVVKVTVDGSGAPAKIIILAGILFERNVFGPTKVSWFVIKCCFPMLKSFTLDREGTKAEGRRRGDG